MSDSSTELQPVFIFSLPRSGSTFLQRSLAAHPSVATVSEPWLLLPLLFNRQTQGIQAVYGQVNLAEAIQDLIDQLPNGEEDYRAAVRRFATDIYGKLAPPGSTHFIDKTPRYHLIAQEICRIFPDAYYIFLWRNPLGIVSSMAETWEGNEWRINNYSIDLFEGMRNLLQVARVLGPSCISVNYETLVEDFESQMADIHRFLGLEVETPLTSPLGILRGRLGDRSESTRADRESLLKWRKTLAGRHRKRWCRRYLNWIGAPSLAYMGYDLEVLLRDLDALPNHHGSLKDGRSALGARITTFRADIGLTRTNVSRSLEKPPPL